MPVVGGVARERIQFNEQSLWSGDNNWDGAYRSFGDPTLTWNADAIDPVVDSPSGHGEGDGKGIGLCVDGRADTKWCVASPGTQVVWRVTFPISKQVRSYSLTSADDVPDRDPQLWILEGSAYGKAWWELDRQVLGKPFEKRFQARVFDITKPQACRFYRFSFTPKTTKHFQVAEIELVGAA